MLSRILAVFSISLIISKSSDAAPAVAKARQFLPAVPGYVPVYIRAGDTPLEEINPDLAEAFNSYSLKHARRSFGRSSNDITDKLDEKEIENDSVGGAKDVFLEDLSLDDKKDSKVSEKPQDSVFHHIQKIPKY